MRLLRNGLQLGRSRGVVRFKSRERTLLVRRRSLSQRRTGRFAQNLNIGYAVFWLGADLTAQNLQKDLRTKSKGQEARVKNQGATQLWGV